MINDTISKTIYFFLGIIVPIVLAINTADAFKPKAFAVNFDVPGCDVRILFPRETDRSTYLEVFRSHFPEDWCNEMDEAQKKYKKMRQEIYLDCEYEYPPKTYPRNFYACLDRGKESLRSFAQDHNSNVKERLSDELSLFQELKSIYPHKKEVRNDVEIARDIFLRISHESDCKWCEGRLYKWFFERADPSYRLHYGQLYERVKNAALSVLKKEAATID